MPRVGVKPEPKHLWMPEAGVTLPPKHCHFKTHAIHADILYSFISFTPITSLCALLISMMVSIVVVSKSYVHLHDVCEWNLI